MNMALRIIAGVLIVAGSFWLTNKGLDYFGGRGSALTRAPAPVMEEAPAECKNLPAIAGQLSATPPSAGHEIVGDGTQPASLESSSHNPQSEVSHIFEKSPSFWHVDLQRKLPEEWIVIDLGSSQIVNDLTVSPRPDAPTQIFKSACWLGSNDRTNWTGIANLTVPAISSPTWISWNFSGRAQAFRYFKLTIPNRSHTFYSIAKMRLSGP